MATKTISITEDAYERLAAKKGPSESFIDVIVKITARRSLMELAGILSDKEADELRKNIEKIRREVDARVDERIEAMK